MRRQIMNPDLLLQVDIILPTPIVPINFTTRSVVVLTSLWLCNLKFDFLWLRIRIILINLTPPFSLLWFVRSDRWTRSDGVSSLPIYPNKTLTRLLPVSASLLLTRPDMHPLCWSSIPQGEPLGIFLWQSSRGDKSQSIFVKEIRRRTEST